MPTDGERINKFLALNLGLARREADELIAEGRVYIDDNPATLGQRVDESSVITVNGKVLGNTPDLVYLMLNKPTDYVCSRRRQGDTPTIYELLPEQYHSLKPVGRLDKNSSGLIILTNDGDFSHQMTHPKFHKTKVYEAILDRPLQPLHRQMISDHGIMLEDGKSKFLITSGGAHPSASLRNEFEASAPPPKARLTPRATSLSVEEPLATASEGTSATQASPAAYAREAWREAVPEDVSSEKANEKYIITMSEGRNRQIRRTFAALDYTVLTLHRTTFGSYTLNDLEPGAYKSIKP